MLLKKIWKEEESLCKHVEERVKSYWMILW